MRYTLIATFCHQRVQELTDNLVELLVQIVHRLRINAERRVERELIADFKRVHGKDTLLYPIAKVSLARPDQSVREVIYPIASPQKLTALVQEQESTGVTYQEKVNATLQVRLAHIWGNATTACASDSKKFGAWDQNLMTEWHARYGGRGVMIYWHVEKKSVCIYSQLKSCSSSEAASMLQGLLRHNTIMNAEKNYVDTHGQNEVAFAFCRLLGFELMPRFKSIGEQRLCVPQSELKNEYPNLKPVLTRTIDWNLIHQQYDQMIKYATALRLGLAET